MSADEMEIVNPLTTGKKSFVDSNNEVHDMHECTFAGDHSNGLDENDKCTICGKSLGDYIAEDTDPDRPHIPILIVPGGQEQ